MIFIDLDDVTADFMGYLNKALGRSYAVGDKVTQEDWDEIRTYHQRIFHDLEPNKEFIPLFQRICYNANRSDIAFLTALPHPDHLSTWAYAPMDKINWVREYCGDVIRMKWHPPVFLGPYAHDKYKHCEIGDVLIDDNATNCADWERAGGIAHLYRNANDCQQFLDTLFNDHKE